MTFTMGPQNLFNTTHNNAAQLIILSFKYTLEVKINFKFKRGVGIAIKSKETSS